MARWMSDPSVFLVGQTELARETASVLSEFLLEYEPFSLRAQVIPWFSRWPLLQISSFEIRLPCFFFANLDMYYRKIAYTLYIVFSSDITSFSSMPQWHILCWESMQLLMPFPALLSSSKKLTTRFQPCVQLLA